MVRNIREVTSSWWSEDDNELGGYGNVSVNTYVSDIVCIADVDNTHHEDHVETGNIDNPDMYNRFLVWSIINDMIHDQTLFK